VIKVRVSIIRPHRYAKHTMRPVAIDVCVCDCLSVCLSVCVTVGHKREPCKKVEPIDMLLGCGLGWALLCAGPDPPRGRDNFWGCFAPRKCIVTARAPKTAIYYLYNIQGGPKKLGPQTHDHNSVKSEPI